ncbi:DUF4138 domain-containing protein [Paraflavitalea sp. CAU 1676]|uniref:DUF4138 domain-containing protein n=1 Tax=Paraflavitalea sp. CAU 1676 TaxID=3032598 RepID=UPI0023D98757|nr:DUF4138 domain-containing protein [Paraflavitalea sp. CAU 1676]MDF2191374.1 DUF4138 domain-containing protein [Paraflavitalea sp. CAU 1676]
MKHIILFCITLIVAKLNAQTITQTGTLYQVSPYKIVVSDKATTVVIFPHAILDADRGNDKLLGIKIEWAENVLKLKASSPQMDTTTLHVFTRDGRYHIFEVAYKERPFVPAYDLRLQPIPNAPYASTPLLLTPEKANIETMENLANLVRVSGNTLFTRIRAYKAALSLQGVFYHENVLFLKFNIHNKATLPLRVNWMRLVLKDDKKSRRTSLQEISIPPLYQDSLPQLSGKTKATWIVAIPLTSLPPNKHLVLELEERDGTRPLNIPIRNRHFLKAQKL